MYIVCYYYINVKYLNKYMSEVTRKSLEVIKAQISTFAAERVEHYQDSGHIFNNLGDLALAEA